MPSISPLGTMRGAALEAAGVVVVAEAEGLGAVLEL
jgi:hypothetical protein